MKAIYITKYTSHDKAFEIREAEIPTPGPNEVCIKVHCFGINFADILARKGLYPDAPKNPAVIGYDIAGTIHQLGANVTNFKIGQRVTALSRFGGYAEYAKTIVEGVVPIPDHLDFASATALTTQGCTAYYAVEDNVTLYEGDQVLIQAAAGGVGSIMVQIAKHKGCFVFGTASSKKQEFLKELGVDVPIDYTKNDFSKVIRSHSKESSGLDVVFDSIGGSAFKKGFNLLKPGGKIVFIGAASQLKNGKANIFRTIAMAASFGIYSPIQMVMSSKAMIGINMLRVADERPLVFQHCLQGVMDLWKQGVIKPKVSKIFDAHDIGAAQYFVESRQSIGKVVCKWS